MDGIPKIALKHAQEMAPDLNDDGVVDKEDREIVAKLDTNKDGFIGEDDFDRNDIKGLDLRPHSGAPPH